MKNLEQMLLVPPHITVQQNYARTYQIKTTCVMHVQCHLWNAYIVSKEKLTLEIPTQDLMANRV